jgi:hypothetical protein
MKKKTISLNRKLILGKETVAALNPHQQDTVVGGATVNNPGCVGSNHCTVNLDCGPIPITKDATCQQLTKLCA